MKTMKKVVALVTVSVFAVSFIAFSQNNKAAAGDKNKMHIKIEVEKDGKTTKIDTTINPDDLAAFNEQLNEMDIHVGTLENFSEVSSFAFATDDKQLQEEMKKLEKQMKDGKFNMDEYEKQMQMQLLEKEMSDSTGMFRYKIKTDDLLRLIEIEKKLGNMNFNFNDDGGTQTITIDGDDVKINGDKDGKEIIIKKEARPRNKKDSKQKKETKKIIIIMKSSSSAPEKQTAEFAAEPVNNEIQSETENAARVRVVEKKDNSWLNELTCYPNPSTGEFTLSFRLSNPEPAELKVMDIAGREVFAENIPENSEWIEKQIKLPTNSSAAYLLILRQGNNWHHEKIFVRS